MSKKTPKRKARFTFKAVKIGKGAKLRSTFDTNVVVTVADDKHVRFDGEVMTLTAAAKILAAKAGKKWPSIQGPMYFTYKDKKLAELR